MNESVVYTPSLLGIHDGVRLYDLDKLTYFELGINAQYLSKTT